MFECRPGSCWRRRPRLRNVLAVENHAAAAVRSIANSRIAHHRGSAPCIAFLLLVLAAVVVPTPVSAAPGPPPVTQANSGPHGKEARPSSSKSLRPGVSPSKSAKTGLSVPSWTWQNPLPNGNPLFAVSCPTVNVCFAAGADGPILATSDGGSSWVQQAQAVGINGVSCASTSDCVVVGDNGYVARTSNSGANWTPTTTNSGNFLAAVTCPTTTVCYAVGYAGSIDRSADGGATWSPQTSGTTNNLFGVSCTSATTCSAVGAGSTLASTTDGGATWIETQMDPYGYSYYAISCWSASGCTAVGQHGIEYTTSIGESNIGSSSDVFAVSCLALYNCFAAAADGLVYIQEQ